MKKYFLLTLNILSIALTVSASTTYNVLITDAAFSPANFTAHVGDTVKWQAAGSNHYNNQTTSLSVPFNAVGWASGPLAPGDSFSYLIAQAGTYSYQSTAYNTFSGGFIVLGKTDSVHRVFISDQGFDPDTFVAHLWDTITWIASPSNRNQNNTFSTSIPGEAIPWTSPTLSPGDSFSYLVTELGTYVYQSNVYINFTGVFIVKDISTGVAEIQAALPPDFNIYPNPACSNFTIETTATGTGEQELQVFDITGKLLLSQSIQNSKTTIDASGLAPGIYLASLKNAEEVATQKLIVTR